MGLKFKRDDDVNLVYRPFMWVNYILAMILCKRQSRHA